MVLTITRILSFLKKTGLLIAAFLISTMAFSQIDYTVMIQNESIVIPENIDSFDWSQMPEHSKFEGGYYGWIQFYETPVQEIQDRFATQDLTLIEYLPNRTYLFYFASSPSVEFLRDNNVRSVLPVPGLFKLSEDLRNGSYPEYATLGDRLRVTLQFHEQTDAAFVIEQLAQQQIAVEQSYRGATNIDLIIPDNCLETLADLPFVKWVELIVAPDVKDDTRGRSLHRASNLDTQTSAGRNYTGEGIGVLVRDDGIVGPHIDFQGRIDNSGASGTG
ncbi:MAG: peptidase S8, partial [Flavobacteriaceae bacterium]|nr:peptidase S8 [Flavobacteriaceae bacterium]